MVAVRTDITMKTILGDYAGTDIVDPIVCITNPNTYIIMIVCARLADYQPDGHWFNPRPARGMNFERSSFAALSEDMDVKPLV